MSIQAMSNVIGSHQHGYQDGSTNRGAVFLVELMIADSVNDQNGNVFWMSNENLAKKCRLARETVNRTVRELEASGGAQTLRLARFGRCPVPVDRPR